MVLYDPVAPSVAKRIPTEAKPRTMNTAAMTPAPGAASSSHKAFLWTGRVLSALPVLAMAASAAMKLAHAPQFVEKWVGTFGYPESAATGIGLLELGAPTRRARAKLDLG